jgi:alcohol dehydrogenase (NADP+)
MEEGKVQREDLFVTTKVWITNYSDPVAALKRSLEDLQLDYVDLYLIHWPITNLGDDGKFEKLPMYKIWSNMEKCVELGLTKNIGVSNFNTQLLADMMTYADITPAVNQVEIHPYC